MIKELVVISGKGGTGKTSVTASLVALAQRPLIADCDVDAPDLHLLLSPKVIVSHDFYRGYLAVINENNCLGCGKCKDLCRFDAIKKRQGSDLPNRHETYTVDPLACEGCGVCAKFCPAHAIDLQECLCGKWMISDTRFGPMVHAQLGVAAENSGKLVSTVREEARSLAKEKDFSLIIVDGPPGIGCPVIASLTGASMVLVVTEPTVSGEHDLERVLLLTRHFGIQAAVCVNKWDINPIVTERIEDKARHEGVLVAGRIRYDSSITKAQMEKQTAIEAKTPASQDIRDVWLKLGLQGTNSKQ